MQLTDRGTALLLSYDRVKRDLRFAGGVRHGRVLDNVVQEVDLATGLVLFEWHSVGEVPLTDSLSRPAGPRSWDYFHVNSVEEDTDGNLIISARNTCALYKLDRATGEILWQMGGKGGDFRMGKGTRFCFQHDARRAGRRGSRCSTTPPGRRCCASSRAGSCSPSTSPRRPCDWCASTCTGQDLRPQPGLDARAAQRQRVRRLGRRAGVLGVLGRRAAAVRRPPDARQGQLPRDPRALDRHAGHEAGGRRRRTRAGRVLGVRELERRDRGRPWQVLAGRPSRLRGVASKARDGFETEITARSRASHVAVRALSARVVLGPRGGAATAVAVPRGRGGGAPYGGAAACGVWPSARSRCGHGRAASTSSPAT